MITLNTKELDFLIKWVKSEDPRCKVIRYQYEGVEYRIKGMSHLAKTETECSEWNTAINRLLLNGFICLESSTSYLLTQKAINYVRESLA